MLLFSRFYAMWVTGDALFEGPRCVLLAIPEIYSWKYIHELYSLISVRRGIVSRVQKAQELHGMEHRSIDLRLVARNLLLSSENMQLFWRMPDNGGKRGWSKHQNDRFVMFSRILLFS